MYQAKEEEAKQQYEKIKDLRQEIEGYMDEHNIKVRYVQPQKTTCFMNRKVTMPKKSISGVSVDEPLGGNGPTDVTDA